MTGCTIEKRAYEAFKLTDKYATYTQKMKDSTKGSAEYNEAKDMLSELEKEYVSNFTGRLELNSDGRLQRRFVPLQADADMMSDPLTAAFDASNAWTSAFIATNVLPRTISVGGSITDAIDTWATASIPLYTDTKNMLIDNWESNEQIKAIKTYISPSLTGIYKELNKLKSITKNAEEDNNKRMDEELKRIDDRLQKEFTQEEIEKLDDIIAKSAIFNLEHNDYLLKLTKGEITLEGIEQELLANMGSNRSLYEERAELLSATYLGLDKPKPTKISYNNKELELLTQATLELDALTTVKALKRIPNAETIIKDLYTNHNDIYNSLIGFAIDIKHLSNKVLSYNNDNMVSRGNLIDDIATIPYEIVAVDSEMLATFEFNAEHSEFKVLREPTEYSVGLVYRESLDRMQTGMSTNISYIKSGIKLGRGIKDKSKYDKSDTKLVYSGNNPVTYLTAEEKKLLKYESNPAKSLLKSWAHHYLILETQAVRDTFLESMTQSYDPLLGMDKVNSDLKDKIADNKHPVFLDLKDFGDRVKTELDPSILKEYRKVETSLLSDIGGFKDKVQYIRKDVAFEVEGYREGGLFKKHSYNRYLTMTRDLIAWIKTNMLIINPEKIAVDLISGYGVASAQGASLPELYKYTKEAVRFSGEMTALRNKRIELQMFYSLANTSEDKKKYRLLVEENEKEIENHPFSGALANGFINSLSTEMLAKERESFSGLQVRIERLIERVVRDNKGELNSFNAAVKKFSKAGLNIEAIYGYVANQAEGKDAKTLAKILKDVSADMAAAKDKDDMTAYISQLILSPNSHFVRLGSAATLYADLIPRWVMYRHFINTGIAEDEAAIKALNYSLDYKMNMPQSLKFMSDLYFMPFPSFFIRIQRVLLAMAKDTPVTFASNLLLTELAGVDGLSIVNSNLLTKFEKDSIFTNTFDIINPGNMVPFSNLITY